jgi:hypothetical protein
MTRVLVYIISPLHVVSTIAALRSLHGKESPIVTLFVHWPGLSQEIVEEIGELVAEISRPFSFIDSVITMSTDERNGLTDSKDLREIVLALRRRLGQGYREIYYAHDIEGGMFNLLCAAFPKAKRICFGDGLGNVYEKHVHLGFLYPDAYASAPTRKGKNWSLREIFEGFRGMKLFKKLDHTLHDIETSHFPPDIATLVLPVDQSGNFLRGVDLIIPEKDLVLDILETCGSSAVELRQYMDDLLQRYHNRQKYILLTDNIAEGDFIEFDAEIEMYCTILKEHCTPESVIFLKSHPGENLPRNEAIKDRLSGVFHVEELNRRFKRYPIELWKPLVAQSKVICLSYPVLSLKYLYGVDVIQPMDDAFVEKWFPEWTWASYKNAITLYMEPLKRLNNWDGKSVLWAGSVPSDNRISTA